MKIETEELHRERRQERGFEIHRVYLDGELVGEVCDVPRVNGRRGWISSIGTKFHRRRNHLTKKDAVDRFGGFRRS